MSSYLRKCVALGPAGTLAPVVAGNDQNLNNGNGLLFVDTNTKWVRMWAPWPELQPLAGYAIGTNPPDSAYDPDPKALGRKPQYQPSSILANLDSQVTTATNLGLFVILTAYRYPFWANAGNRTSSDYDWAHADSYFMPSNNDPVDRAKFVFPDDLSTGSLREVCRLLNHPLFGHRPTR